MVKRKIFALLAAILAVSLFPAPVRAMPTVNDERGVIRYEQVIAPQYEDAGKFSEGLAPVKLGGKWGYIDENNNVAIGFSYDWANPFREGFAVVGSFTTMTFNQYDYETGESYTAEQDVAHLGRIDKAGNYKPFRGTQYYWETESFEVGNMIVNREWFDFKRTTYYYNGWVSIDHRIFDMNGEQFRTVDDDRYRAYRVPAEGLVLAVDDFEESYVYLDMAGNVVLELPVYRYYDAEWNEVADPYGENWESVRYGRGVVNHGFASSFNQGLALVSEFTYDVKSNEAKTLLGVIDKKGNWVVRPQYDYYWISDEVGECKAFCSAGLAALGIGGKRGAIDRTGKTVIPFIYEDLQIFREGLAAYKQGELYGYIDTAGSVVIPVRYVAASGFSGGIAVVYDGITAFLIDRKGNKIRGADAIDPDNYFGTYSDGVVWVQQPTGKYVIIKESGKYGYGRISYTPPLPEQSEMDGWAYNEVIAAIEADLVPAELLNMYRSNITRADYCSLIVTVVCAILNKEAADMARDITGKTLDVWRRSNPFTDTADDSVIAAYALGLVTGYEDGSFRPYNQITRQEAAVLLWRAAGLLGMDNEAPPVSGFADRGLVQDWAVKQVDYVSSIGVMNGVGENEFSPTGSYTRQQSYMTIWRLFNAKR